MEEAALILLSLGIEKANVDDDVDRNREVEIVRSKNLIVVDKIVST
jgi:hypothetical protein